MYSNRKAELLLNERKEVGDNSYALLRVWVVPEPVRGPNHSYKYSLALIVEDECVMRYDNEAGKGDHKLLGKAQLPYFFKTIETLIVDFRMDVDLWVKK